MEIVIHNRRHRNEDPEYPKDEIESVSRPSVLGNPFTLKQYDRVTAIEKYKQWLNLQWSTGNTEVQNELLRLKTKLQVQGTLHLECWCAPEPCHANVIAEALLNLIERD